MISPHTDQEPRREKQFSKRARKEKGAHYTPNDLAAFVAEQIAAHLPAGKKHRVLDPAVGDGALLHALARKLGDEHHYEGYDIDAPALDHAAKLLTSVMPRDSFSLHHSDFLAHYGGADDDFFHTPPQPEYDATISNPPYVRTQVLGHLPRKGLPRFLITADALISTSRFWHASPLP